MTFEKQLDTKPSPIQKLKKTLKSLNLETTCHMFIQTAP